jgi:hypothetical protein
MYKAANTGHHYVYECWGPDNDVVFYVGKGCWNRAWSFRSRNRQFMKILEELYDKKLCRIVRIYEANLTSREALKIEMARMAYWAGRFITLSNITGAYRRDVKRLRRLRNMPTPETMARVRRMFG